MKGSRPLYRTAISASALLHKCTVVTDNHGISSSLRAFFIGACLLLGCSSRLPAQPYSYRQYTVDDGLPTNAVYGGLQDSRGYIWFYTEKGVSRFDGYSFTNFTVRDGLPANDIFMLSEDAQGRLWPHSFGRKVVAIDGDTVLTLAESTTIDFLRFTILEDGRNVWFVDNNERYAIRESEGGYDTLSMTKNCKSLGNLGQAGVSYPYKWDTTICFDPGRAHVLQISYTSGTVVKEFPMDGLAVYDGKGEHYFGDDPELGRKNIWDIAVCSDGKAWVGTDGYGLYLFSEGKATPIRGTGDDIISDVAIGPEGKVWIATNRGVKFIVPGSSPDSSYVEQVLTTNNGLPTIEANAVFADEEFVYVGTDAGLTIIDRSLPFRDTTLPLLIMDEVKVNGQRVPVEEGFQLRHFQNELELAYTGISYKSFGNITYEYQLENADKAMQRTSARRVRYTGLQPGTYTFHLRAIDIKGIASAPLPPMVFIIRPPWWQTHLALFCGALLLAAAVFGGYRWRVHIIHRRAAAETAINKRFAELELQALQSQMNPHFIFNSLGAIQHFIQENDKKQADLYLSKFAFLMRLFLESSKNKYINLSFISKYSKEGIVILDDGSRVPVSKRRRNDFLDHISRL